MPNNFSQRKKDVLSKEDKSSIGGWDRKIKGLCEKINLLDNYYTTSSCSGRVVLIVDQLKKSKGLFRFVSHDLISFEVLWKEICSLNLKENIKFKQEPCILHVVCKDLESAENLLKKGRDAGWKKSGILSLGKNIIVELNSTERLEFPVVRNKKLLVDKEFVNEIVEISNERLKKTWKKIEKLEKFLN